MTRYLCISVTFLDPLFHGKCDHDEPEWPPSPLRLFQALLKGARTGCRNLRWSPAKADAFRALEHCAPPLIVAPDALRFESYTLFVPNNDSDKEFNRQNRLTSKVSHPYRLSEKVEDRRIHYLWHIGTQKGSLAVGHAELLCDEARNLLALGWGIDQAVASGCILKDTEVRELRGNQWRCISGRQHGDLVRRTPRKGTLDDLEQVYASFLNSVSGRQYYPPLKSSVYDRVVYGLPNYIQGRPSRVFELRNTDGSSFRYPHRRLIHIAGMVRHLAIEAMKKDPPRGVDPQWIEAYVAGHAPDTPRNHHQLSYLPLPSVGHEHTDPGVRRVMIAAPMGDGAWLDHVVRRLAGQALIPEPDKPDPFAGREAPLLIPRPQKTSDGVIRCYTKPSDVWHSFTPVILPGHDDRKPDKTRALIEKALKQSGIEHPCEFEWSAFSRFRKSYSAHKYDKNKLPQGYIRPRYLNSQTAVHLTIRFHNGSTDKKPVYVPGPIAIGAGRHCGLGLMARGSHEHTV